MKELTKAEEQIMQVIWDLDKAFVKEVIQKLPNPKPAYNTVSTIVRILEEKGFVDHESFGKSHRYFALISKSDYRSFATSKLLKGYFGGKFENLLSHFANEKNLSLEQLQDILNQANEPNENNE
jgi:predicted transcriptional regulator